MLILFVVFVLASSSISFNGTDYCALLNQLVATPGYLLEPASVINAHNLFAAALLDIPTHLWTQWNISLADLNDLLSLAKKSAFSCQLSPSTPGFDFHPFAPCLDGLVLAPKSHTLAFASNITQVIHWHLPPQYQEPFHTHVLASLTFDVRSAGIIYFDSHNQIVEHTAPHESSVIKVESQASEWLHSIKNIDDHTYEVIRVFVVPQSNISYSPFQ